MLIIFVEIPFKKNKMKLPVKTVQRLSKYRRLLLKYRYLSKPYIFSHDLARLFNLNPVQVRRDLMLIGASGNNRNGYNINELIDLISDTIDIKNCKNIAIIGMGKMGQAILNYVTEEEKHLNIVAVFDIDPHKVNKTFEDIVCYDIRKISEIVRKKNILIGIITVPSDYAVSISNILIESGIKGILNFTSVHLDLPENIYLKEFDIITFFDEIAFFIK